jgi:hypothetical protein
MNSEGAGERHLSSEGLAHYIAAGVPSLIKIEGAPITYLVIEPMVQRLALRTPLTRHSLPDVSAYQHISAVVIHWNDGAWFEVRADGAVMLEAYPVLCAIADRIQIDGIPFDAAVSGSLAAFRQLFSRHSRLTFEEEIGLYAELLLVNHLLAHFPPQEAVSAWRGPDGEEHDFDIAGNDVEVKCTVAEERIHWINDGNQLEPTCGRPLWILSIQLTGASGDGHSLADLIALILSRLTDAHAVDLFKAKLAAVRWREESPLLHTSTFRLRTEPAVFSVDDSFPALTRRRLTAAGVDLARVISMRYALNLSGLPQATVTPEVLKNISVPK